MKKGLTKVKVFDIIARHSAEKRVLNRNRTQGDAGLMLNPEGKNLGAPKPSDKQVRGNYEGSSKRTKLSFGVPEKDP